MNTNTNTYQESWIFVTINRFLMSTISVWRSMYDTHIVPLKSSEKIDVIKNDTHLTHYHDYVSLIRNFQIKLPDWFILSNGSVLQKIIPCYDTQLDFLPLALVDVLFIKDRGKTLILTHMCNTMKRSGMHVSDVPSRILFKALGNPYCLSYIRMYSTSPESCFMIRDHYEAYYEHIKYALLEKNITRMVLLSSKQILIMIDILKELKVELIDELLLLDLERAEECRYILFNERNPSMSGVFKKLWPDLNVIILLKDGGYRIQSERIKKYTKDIKLYSPIYYLPEITIGYNINNSLDSVSNTYVLDPRKGYFEFKCVNDDRKIDNIRNLKIGELYNIIVSTTTTGFCRYITGDIVKIVGYYNEVPEIELICRESDLLIDRKKDSIKTVITPQSIEIILLRKFREGFADYCYKQIDSKTNIFIKLYIELEETEYDDNDVKQHIKDLDIVDTLLDGINLDAAVMIVKSGTFNNLYKYRYSEYTDPALIQIPRLCVDPYDLEILSGNIIFTYR